MSGDGSGSAPSGGDPAAGRPILAPALRLPLLLVTGLAAAVAVLLGVRFANWTTAGPLEGRVAPWLERTVAEWREVALVIDFAGEPVGLAALTALLVAVSVVLRRPRVAVLAVLGTGLAITVTTVAKPLAHRVIHGEHLSYPSGHTASATALAMIVVMLVWTWLRPAWAMVLLVGAALLAGLAAGWAQAGLVAHYPADTVGGWCTALAVVPATAWLIDRAADHVRVTVAAVHR